MLIVASPAFFVVVVAVVFVWQAVQISRASPSWQGYIQHVSGVVLDGLTKSTLTSLRSMLNSIVSSNLSKVRGKMYFLVQLKQVIAIIPVSAIKSLLATVPWFIALSFFILAVYESPISFIVFKPERL